MVFLEVSSIFAESWPWALVGSVAARVCKHRQCGKWYFLRFCMMNFEITWWSLWGFECTFIFMSDACFLMKSGKIYSRVLNIKLIICWVLNQNTYYNWLCHDDSSKRDFCLVETDILLGCHWCCPACLGLVHIGTTRAARLPWKYIHPSWFNTLIPGYIITCHISK